MATEVTERWKPLKFSKSESTWGAYREFEVLGLSNPEQVTRAVDDTTGLAIPQINDVHPDAPRLRVRNIDTDRQSIEFWIVKVDYGQPSSGSDYDESPDDPLLAPTKIKWGHRNERQPFDVEANGFVPITNSALQPFATQPTKDVSVMTLELTRNEPGFDVALAKTALNKINNGPFFVDGRAMFNRYEGLLTSVEPSQAYTDDDDYVTVTYRFDIKDNRIVQDQLVSGHDLRVLDVGYSELIRPKEDRTPRAGGTIINIPFNQVGELIDLVIPGSKDQTTTPQKLDGKGRLFNTTDTTFEGADPWGIDLGLNAIPLVEITDDGVWLYYERYLKLDFDVFGF